MRTAGGRLVFTPREAFEGAASAHRKGDDRNALVLARLLVRGIKAREVRGLGAGEIAVITEVERESSRRLGIKSEVDTDGI